MSNGNVIPAWEWDGMKVLTVREPWASLIVGGYKDVENRNWVTLYRGPVLIHASAGMSKREYSAAWEWIGANVPVGRLPNWLRTYGECRARAGQILGGCVIVGVSSGPGCWRMEDSRFGWELRDMWKTETPVACKGELGLWTFRVTSTALRSPASEVGNIEFSKTL